MDDVSRVKLRKGVIQAARSFLATYPKRVKVINPEYLAADQNQLIKEESTNA